MNALRTAALALAAALWAACAGPDGRAPPAPGASGLDPAAAREVLVRFASLVEAGDLERAVPLLSARWRERTTGARLARDLAGAGAGAREAVARARRAGPAAPVTLEPGRARLSLGQGKEALLVAEGGAWRVDALELAAASR